MCLDLPSGIMSYGTIDPRYRLLAFIRDRFTCQRCGSTEDLTVHHCIPRRKGGRNQPWNLLTVCDDCHKLIELKGGKLFRYAARQIALGRKPAQEPSWLDPGLPVAEMFRLRETYMEQELLKLVKTW